MEVLPTAADTAGFEELATPIQLALLLGGMALMSAALVSLTAFTRIVIVLSFVRRALATQEIPPNSVIIGLSLFMTLFVMGPTFDAIHEKSVTPLMEKEITTIQAVQRGADELRVFMLRHTRKDDLMLFMHMSRTESISTPAQTPMRILIPAFIISELKTAFIMGFCVYIPFLLIDLVISTVLMSLGMMMMPPMIVSTPCKIMLFVMVDGWHLVIQSIGQSFA